MINKSLKKSTALIVLFVVLAAAFCAAFSGLSLSNAAERQLPQGYTEQWFDNALYLDYGSTFTEINNEIKSKTNIVHYRENPIVIAVIDTGINLSHEVFDGLLHSNSGEIAGNNTDDDGNGYRDDVNGFNFVGNNADVSDNCTDPDSHGTHVAGIVAREIIKYGLRDYIRIMPIKAGNDKGKFTSANTKQAIRYAVDNGANVINMSLRSYMSDSGWNANSDLAAAVKYAYDKNVVLVAAAGNDGKPSGTAANTSSPAALDGVIGVMSYDEDGTLSYDFNYGSAYDVVAPGKNIYSAMRESADAYAIQKGTSMASPFVAFMAAVLMIKYDKIADVVDYTFENCTAKTIQNYYKAANLAEYLKYSPVDGIKIEKTAGNDSQNIGSALSEVTYSVGIKKYGETDYLPKTDEIYGEVKWIIRLCDANGNEKGDPIIYNGAELNFLPPSAGRFKIYAKIPQYNRLTSNSMYVDVAYAELSEVELSVNGETDNLRAGETYFYSVNNYNLLDPDTVSVFWYVYLNGGLFKTYNGSTFKFTPQEKGDYKIVCRLEADGTLNTVDEVDTLVKISKKQAAKIAAYTVAPLIIVGAVAFAVTAIVSAVRSKKRA